MDEEDSYVRELFERKEHFRSSVYKGLALLVVGAGIVLGSHNLKTSYDVPEIKRASHRLNYLGTGVSILGALTGAVGLWGYKESNEDIRRHFSSEEEES